jgi:predicted aspartyl protease
VSKPIHEQTSKATRTAKAARRAAATLSANAAVAVILLAMVSAPVGAASDDTLADLQSSTRPGPAPGTYTITPNADSIRIPFDLFRGEIRLAGRMNGQEVRMLIDNGALWDELLFFGSQRVDSLGMKREGQAEVGGAGSGEPIWADMASGLSLCFDGEDGRTIEFHDQTAIIMPYDPDAPNPWWGSEGQVSSILFKNFVVEFDFDESVMTLTRPERFDPADKGTEIPIRPVVDSGSWSLPGAITLVDGRRLELDMTMDLGWDEPLAVNTGQAHDIQLPPNLTRTRLGLGAQGPIYGYFGTVRALEIGGHRFEDVLTTYSSVAEGGSKVDEVMVGLGIFTRFHIAFDYPRHRLFAKPNRSFGDPFRSHSR